jgi:EmrB/QacA subfamily drug resistance transporter
MDELLKASTPHLVEAPPEARGPLARLRASHWSALPVLLAGTFLIVLDFFIVNVALPSMQTELHATTTMIEWVVAGYGLTFAVLLLAAGRFGDRWGRRRLFAIGVGTFTVASAVCGVAPNATVLVVARLAQGAAAALISPTVLAIIGVVYTGKDRARAIGMYATVMGLAAAGGQLIGGLLLSANIAGLGWRTVFLINVPVGIVALLATPKFVPESREARPARTDVIGLVLATVGVTALILPLLEGRQEGWPVWTWVSLAAAPPFLVEFALRQRALVRRAEAPLLDPRLFRSRSFTAGLVAQFALWGGQASYFLILALFLQEGRGLSALQSGLVFTIVAAAYLIGSAKAPALSARYGRTVVTAGAVLLAIGHLALMLATTEVGVGGSVLTLAPGLLFAGVGMGLCITALTTTVLSDADPQQAGAVSGALSSVQQIGNAVGVAVIGLIFFGGLGSGYAHAFDMSLIALAGLLGVLAVLSRFLPRKDTAVAETGIAA